MNTQMNITFRVTPSQKETINSRMLENGFDDISAYLKVSALKIQEFNITSAGESLEEASVELGFRVSEAQNLKLEEKVKESGCQNMTVYLRYIALHAVVTAVAEVRSTGNLEAMLQRIADSRK